MRSNKDFNYVLKLIFFLVEQNALLGQVAEVGMKVDQILSDPHSICIHKFRYGYRYPNNRTDTDTDAHMVLDLQSGYGFF